MSKIDIIDSILHEDFKVNTNLLEEINIDKNRTLFMMKRRVISKKDINYSIYHYEKSQNFLPFFTNQDSNREEGKE